jgi:hypothetical protein
MESANSGIVIINSICSSSHKQILSIIGMQDQKTKSLRFLYLIPVIPKTWQETWQVF